MTRKISTLLRGSRAAAGNLRCMAVSLTTYSPIDDHRYVRPVVLPVPRPRPDDQTTSPWRTVFSVTARASTN